MRICTESPGGPTTGAASRWWLDLTACLLCAGAGAVLLLQSSQGIFWASVTPLATQDLHPVEGPVFRAASPRITSLLRDAHPKTALTENGVPLPQMLENSLRVKKGGAGSYTVGAKGIWFRASDDSDARTNGRAYAIRLPEILPSGSNLGALALLAFAAAVAGHAVWHGMEARSRAFCRKAFVSVTATAVATVALALVSLCLSYVYRAIWHPFRAPIPFDTPSQIQWDKDIGFVPRPNLAIEIKVGDSMQRVFTDSRGFRIHASGLNAPDQADIVVIGCSQTWGHGVPAEKTFASEIGRALRRETVNLGVPAYGGVTSLKRLQQNWNLRPKLVVYGYWIDHDARNVSQGAGTVLEFCSDQAHVVVDRDGPRFVPPLSSTGIGMENSGRLARATGTGRPDYPFWSDVYWLVRLDWLRVRRSLGLEEGWMFKPPNLREAGTRFLLRELAKDVSDHGARLLVVYLSNYSTGKSIPEAPQFLRDELARLQVEFFEMRSDFASHLEAHGDGSLTILGDGHLNADGHALVAMKIARFVEEKRLLE